MTLSKKKKKKKFKLKDISCDNVRRLALIFGTFNKLKPEEQGLIIKILESIKKQERYNV